MNKAFYCAAMWLIACVVTAEEFDQQKMKYWHQWRGPDSTGVAPLGDPPVKWSETQNI